jgi:hypothetical protein
MEFEQIFAEFRNETDRAVVILAAAMLDEQLRELLAARLVPNTSGDDTFLDGDNAPLSAFSSRINGCHRIGLISAMLARDMHLVRKVRNDFAHLPKICSFEEQSVKDRVTELKCSHGLYERSPEWLKGQGIILVREDFVIAVSGMLAVLGQAISESTSLPAAAAESMYSLSIDDWEEQSQQ